MSDTASAREGSTHCAQRSVSAAMLRWMIRCVDDVHGMCSDREARAERARRVYVGAIEPCWTEGGEK